jgi:hypothetical protein
MALVMMRQVCPSAGARATISVPITVPPPARLSITACCPSNSPKRGASVRATASTGPPAGNGATSRIDLLGKAGPELAEGVCACAAVKSGNPTMNNQGAMARIMLAATFAAARSQAKTLADFVAARPRHNAFGIFLE